MKQLNVEETFASIKPVDRHEIQSLLKAEQQASPYKIVVLDDDPTGIQTVHGVSVFTDWTKASIQAGFKEDQSMFFILTNSRGFTEEETIQCHEEIAERVQEVADAENTPYLLISRGDSTLRGHYPLETETIKTKIESMGQKHFDGEIIIPFFKEGGRFTINNIHYVQNGTELVPAGETEFANDRTFGFASSHLGEYIEEKTNGRYQKEETIYISLEDLRDVAIEKITAQLSAATDFQKNCGECCWLRRC